MKAIRLTQPEVKLLNLLLGPEPTALVGYVSVAQQRVAALIRHKLSDASQAKTRISTQRLEKVLIDNSSTKVLALITGHDRACRQAHSLGITESQMATMGAWLSQQTWIKSKLTMIDVLNKWSQWWPKAVDEFTPAARPSTLTRSSSDTGPDISEASPVVKAGRPTQGFR